MHDASFIALRELVNKNKIEDLDNHLQSLTQIAKIKEDVKMLFEMIQALTDILEKLHA